MVSAEPPRDSPHKLMGIGWSPVTQRNVMKWSGKDIISFWIRNCRWYRNVAVNPGIVPASRFDYIVVLCLGQGEAVEAV